LHLAQQLYETFFAVVKSLKRYFFTVLHSDENVPLGNRMSVLPDVIVGVTGIIVMVNHLPLYNCIFKDT